MFFESNSSGDFNNSLEGAIESNLILWGLSKETIKVLVEEPEIVDYLAKKRYLPSFPVDYEPLSLEVRLDDATYYYQECGKLPYIRPSSSDYNPAFSEYLVDGEILVFKVGRELVIDRSANLTAKNFNWAQFWPSYQLPRQL